MSNNYEHRWYIYTWKGSYLQSELTSTVTDTTSSLKVEGMIHYPCHSFSKEKTILKTVNRWASNLLLAMAASLHQSSNTWSRSSSRICALSRAVPFVMFLPLHCCNCCRRLRTTSLSLWIFLSCDNNIYIPIQNNRCKKLKSSRVPQWRKQCSDNKGK